MKTTTKKLTKKFVKSIINLHGEAYRGKTIGSVFTLDSEKLSEYFRGCEVEEKIYSNMIKWGWIYNNGFYCIGQNFPY